MYFSTSAASCSPRVINSNAARSVPFMSPSLLLIRADPLLDDLRDPGRVVTGNVLCGRYFFLEIGWRNGRRGTGELVGQVLSENTPMLGLVRKLGFSSHLSAEGGFVEVRVQLSES